MAAASAQAALERRRLRLIGRRRRRRRLGLRRLADLKRIDPHRFGNVFERRRAEIADLQIEPRLDLAIRILGKTDRPGLSHPLQPRGDVDAVAHEIAVALLDDIADMDADTEFDSPLGRHAGVALDEAGLHFDRAAHRVDHAAELDDASVAGALDDAAVMGGDRRVDEIAAEAPKARESPVLVGAGEPAVADDIGDQDRREFPGLAHCVSPAWGET